MNIKYQISNIKSQKGFTFIELMLYISIVTIMTSALIPFALNVIGGSFKSSTQQEVYSTARYITERLKYEIRNTDDIDFANSDFDIDLATDNTKKITLTQQSSNTVININSSGILQISKGSDPSPLNSQDTKVTSLIFTDYTSSDNKSKHVGFTIAIEDNFPDARHEFQESVSLRGSAEIRNN